MSQYRTMLLFILPVAGILSSQPADDKRTPVDSLEKMQAQLIRETDAIQSRLDSLNAIVRMEYIRSGLSDTITAVIEKDGVAYEQPDILSTKRFEVKAQEIIVLIGFSGEWFKIIHKKGVAFLMEDAVKHDEKMYNYIKLQLKVNPRNNKNQ